MNRVSEDRHDLSNVVELDGDRPSGVRSAPRKSRSRSKTSCRCADILNGLSPRRQSQFLTVMASKSREMVEVLTPFLDEGARVRPPIAEYRRVRARTRRLVVEYRLLLSRLHDSLSVPSEPPDNRGRPELDLVSGER
jgi:hypothetical protein